jgi:ferredoxin-NADP reductase
MTTVTQAFSAMLTPDRRPPRVWDDSAEQLLVCRGIVPVTDEISTFVFEALEPRFFRHLPGQYLTLTVEIDEQLVSRCYTISSPTTRPYAMSISVKREPGGLVSNWLHDNLKVGDWVRATGPLGSFTFAEHPSAKYLFLSAGVGITPSMSMIRTLHDLAEPTDVVLVHSVRSPEHIVFRSELNHLAASDPNLRVEVICEDAGNDGWDGRRGRLTSDMLAEITPDLHEREIFLCGPAAYMTAAQELLSTAGVDASRIHTESFSFEAPESSSNDAAGTDHPAFTVQFTRSNQTVECTTDGTVLQAAIAAGIRVPSSCGGGMCGTCKTTLVRGSVDMKHDGGIRPKEIAQGKILLCCSKPLEDLIVEA